MRSAKPIVLTLAACLATEAGTASSSRGPDLSAAFFNNAESVILFLGDSITSNGAYIGDLQDLLKARFPGMRARFVKAGKASETVSHLTEEGHPGPRPWLFDRLAGVLAAEKPDLVFACYGMNDGIYHPYSADRAKAYQDGIHRLIKDVKGAGAHLVLVSPPVFDSLKDLTSLRDAPPYKWTTPYRNYDSVLGAYGAWLTTLRSDSQAVVDLHAHMLSWVKEKRKSNSGFTWTSDGIHPSAEGHEAMAKAINDGLFMPVSFVIRGATPPTSPTSRGYNLLGAALRPRPAASAGPAQAAGVYFQIPGR